MKLSTNSLAAFRVLEQDSVVWWGSHRVQSDGVHPAGPADSATRPVAETVGRGGSQSGHRVRSVAVLYAVHSADT